MFHLYEKGLTSKFLKVLMALRGVKSHFVCCYVILGLHCHEIKKTKKQKKISG